MFPMFALAIGGASRQHPVNIETFQGTVDPDAKPNRRESDSRNPICIQQNQWSVIDPLQTLARQPYYAAMQRLTPDARIAWRLAALAFMFCITACVSYAQVLPAASAEFADPTEGWITMTKRGDIFIYFDRNPDQPVGCIRQNGGCDSYLELAGGLAPGQRKRMPVAGADYYVSANGNISLIREVTVGPHTQQVPYDWATGTPQHNCYRQELASHFTVGQHIMTRGSRQRIERCLAGIAK
jgi:hypothetical protein